MNTWRFLPSLGLVLLCAFLKSTQAAAAQVEVLRVPDAGMQPQMSVGPKGVIHLIYLTGDPSRSDIEYCRSSDGGATWSAAIRVNSQRGSALAIGTVRGAQLAIGREGRVHVAWMGSNTAEPKAPQGLAPMLYARLAIDGKSFESQRNVITSYPGVDGGGSVAADRNGNVYVAWHAPAVAKGKEQDRRVWVARSTDDGDTFAPEVSISDPDVGACGCCGMRVFVGQGKVLALYRGARHMVDRGMHLIDASADLVHWRDREIDPMRMGMCIMSTSALNSSPNGTLLAWETNGQIAWAQINGDAVHPHPVPGSGKDRKHPAMACDRNGNVLLAWTEGTAWNKGGSVAWQLLDPSGNTLPNASGRRDDLPPWDAPAVACSSDGKLIVLY